MGINVVDSRSEQLNNKKEKIIKFSKRIKILLKAAKFAMAILGILFSVVTIFILLGLINIDKEIHILSYAVNVLMPINDFTLVFNERDALLMTYGIATILSLVIAVLMSYIEGMIDEWSKGNSPFTAKNLLRIRYISITTVIFMWFFQPLFVFIGIALYVFTYLMEYGEVLEEQANETIHSHEQMILSMAEIIEAKSGQTGLHVKRVSEYSKILAEGYGLKSSVVEEIRIASMLHDVGKLLIPSEILEKPGKLTSEEFEVIKKHTNYGETLLENTNGTVLNRAKLIASEHHEKWDGTGYAGKKGNEISVVARIVAVADVYDALVSNRSYKNAWSSEKAIEEIKNCAGTHFDPKIVKIFCENYERILEVKEKFAN